MESITANATPIPIPAFAPVFSFVAAAWAVVFGLGDGCADVAFGFRGLCQTVSTEQVEPMP